MVRDHLDFKISNPISEGRRGVAGGSRGVAGGGRGAGAGRAGGIFYGFGLIFISKYMFLYGN